MDPNVIKDTLSLTPQEIRALWTPIEWAIDPKYWADTETPGYPKVFMDGLAKVTYLLLQHMITHFARGKSGKASRSLSEKVVRKDLRITSDTTDPSSWPKISPLCPKTSAGWHTRDTSYPAALENPDFKDLIARYRAALPESHGTDLQDEDDDEDDDEDNQDDDDQDENDQQDLESSSGTCSDESDESDLEILELSAGEHEGALISELAQLDAPPTTPVMRGFGAIDNSSSPPPGFAGTRCPSPDGVARSLLTRLGPSDMEPKDLGVTPGFGLGAHDPPGVNYDNLPETAMTHINVAHDVDLQARQNVADMLFDKGLADEWYADEQAAHIASLGSIGKAEYAIQCLNQDMARWKVAIVAIGQRLQKADQIIAELHTARTKAIEQEKMYADIEASYRVKTAQEAEAKREAHQQKMKSQNQGPGTAAGLSMLFGGGENTRIHAGNGYPVSSTRSSSSTLGATSSNSVTGTTSMFYQPDPNAQTKPKKRKSEKNSRADKHSRKRLRPDETNTSMKGDPSSSRHTPVAKGTPVAKVTSSDNADISCVADTFILAIPSTPHFKPVNDGINTTPDVADFLSEQLRPRQHQD